MHILTDPKWKWIFFSVAINEHWVHYFFQDVLKCFLILSGLIDIWKTINCSPHGFIIKQNPNFSEYFLRIQNKSSLFWKKITICMIQCKETKGRSLGQTPFTMIIKITKTASPKNRRFNRLNKSPLYLLLDSMETVWIKQRFWLKFHINLQFTYKKVSTFGVSNWINKNLV